MPTSVNVFKNILNDISKIKSNNLYSEEQLLVISAIENISSTVDFYKFLEDDDKHEEQIIETYDLLTRDIIIDQTTSPDDIPNLQLLFEKIVRLPPLKTEVNFL